MSNSIHIEEYKGYTIELEHDQTCENPMEMNDDNVKLVSYHGRYGTNHGFKIPQDLLQHVEDNGGYLLPVYFYDHSGTSYSLSNAEYPFNDRFDSGLYGYLFFEKKSLEERGAGELTNENKKRLYEVGELVLAEYQQWANGECYTGVWYVRGECSECGHETKKEENGISGLIGMEYAIEYAKQEIDLTLKS